MKRLLLVEDNIDLLHALCFTVNEYGYDVVCCNTPQEVFNAFEQNEFDIIVMDVFLSGADGRELIKTIRRDAHYKNTPVLMISAVSGIKSSVLESGADDFLTKPFNVSEFLERVGTLTSESKTL